MEGGRWLLSNAGLHKGTISAVVNQVVFNPLDSATIYAATTTGIFRSRDGGRSWNERMKGMIEVSFVVCLAVDPERPNVMYAGTSGGVYRSLNATESWAKISSGMVPDDTKMASMALGVNSIVINPSETTILYAGTTKGLFKTTNGGDHWDHLRENLGEPYISGIQLDPLNPQILYLATSEGIQKSLNEGETWTLKNEGLETTSIRAIQMSPQDPQTLYIGTNGGGLYRTINSGTTWTRLPLTPASSE